MAPPPLRAERNQRMTPSTTLTVTVRDTITLLKRQWRLWLIPTIVVTSMATLYACFKPDRWNAVQVVLVRDEASLGTSTRRGRFESTDAMKSAQETIQEISRNRSVLESTLRQAGPPPKDRHPERWPRADDIKDFSEDLHVTSPNGTEFGQTEAIHLSVDAKTTRRAAALATALYDQIESQMQQLRDARAASIITETENSVAMAEADVLAATASLQNVESEVGSDLGELRILNESGNGDSNLRSMLTQIETELRKARADHQASNQQHAMLLSALQNPAELIATPNRLLESQPALRRLKEGLIDAELRTATLRGRMSDDHPQVLAAIESESLVRQRLQNEISTALLGLQADQTITQALVDSLQQQQSQVAARLDRLSERRAPYSALVANQKQCLDVLQVARTEMAQARAEQLAARSVSVLTRLNEPQLGDDPIGPSRAAIVLAGLVGGLATGLGLVFLNTPFGQQGRSVGNRCSDYLRRGRRKESRPDAPGRRCSDRENPAPTPADARPSEERLAAAMREKESSDPRGLHEEDPLPRGYQPAYEGPEQRIGLDRRRDG